MYSRAINGLFLHNSTTREHENILPYLFYDSRKGENFISSFLHTGIVIEYNCYTMTTDNDFLD